MICLPPRRYAKCLQRTGGRLWTLMRPQNHRNIPHPAASDDMLAPT